VYCKTGTTVAFGTAPVGGYKSVPTGAIGSPTNGDVNMYTAYMVGQTTYTCDYFPGGTTALTGTSGVTTKTSSSSNPAGIWYCDGNLVLNDYVTVDGTLIVKGNLTINGKGIVLSPKTNYPGLIVTGNMQINQSKKVMTINGVCYVGGQVKSSGVPLLPADSSMFTVNGGLLSKDGFGSGYNVTTTVKLDSTMSKAPDLSSVGRSNTGVTILRWGPVVAAPY